MGRCSREQQQQQQKAAKVTTTKHTHICTHQQNKQN